ncbi:MAG: hypothetical protein ACREUF_04325, partial [Solimonas sp.]
EGEVHIVAWASGAATRREEVVLTRDPRLSAVIKTLAAPNPMENKAAKSSLKDEAIGRGYFLLKSGEYVVTQVDFAPTAEERFALKAKPSDDIELAFQIMFAAAFAPVGEAVSKVTDALGAAVAGTLGAGAETKVAVPEGPSPLTRERAESQRQAESQLLRIARPQGLQLPLPKTDYRDWLVFDDGPLSVYLSDLPTRVASGNGSIEASLRMRREHPVHVYLGFAGYRQQAVALDAVGERYRVSARALGEGKILGYQPLALDGIAGTLEIYQEQGEDGGPERRVVEWQGYRQDGEQAVPILCVVRTEPAHYEKLAPLIGGILQSIRVAPAGAGPPE